MSMADSAVLLGVARIGRDTVLAQGAVVRSHDGCVTIGASSAVLENCVVVGRRDLATNIGHKTTFGHRCTVIGATVGNLCEVGNGSTLLSGSSLGDRVFLGERTLVLPGTHIPDDSVAVGAPARVVRRASAADIERLTRLRDGDLDLPSDTVLTELTGTEPAGAEMGKLYAFRDKSPDVSSSAIVFDSAEITGDVVIGDDTIIGSGVRIIGDSHGPVRIGARVQILENSVLHLLPDNELIIDDDVVIGPASMIHGCRIGRGTVVEPAATVCDWSVVGAHSVVRAGAVVKQRDAFGDRVVLDGFPAKQVDVVDGEPPRPAWALRSEDLETLVRVR